jgi:hypothetical protein
MTVARGTDSIKRGRELRQSVDPERLRSGLNRAIERYIENRGTR